MKKLSCDTLIIQSCYDFKLYLLLLSRQAMYSFWAVGQVTTMPFPKNFLAAGKCLIKSLKGAVSKELLKYAKIKIQNAF